MSRNSNMTMSNPLSELWVIYDPLDGLHVFGSEKKARKTLAKWEKEADGSIHDSVWDMSEPIRYIIDTDVKREQL